MRKIWLNHGIPTLVARKLEATVDTGGWETLYDWFLYHPFTIPLEVVPPSRGSNICLARLDPLSHTRGTRSWPSRIMPYMFPRRRYAEEGAAPSVPNFSHPDSRKPSGE